MIVDELANCGMYAALHPGLALAFGWLKRTELATVATGKHVVDGDRVFALVQEYQSKTARPIVWESHRKYIDVQLIVSGRERMGCTPLSSGLTVTRPYDEAGDAALYTGEGSLLYFTAGMFAVYGPRDVHAPGVAWADAAEPVRKVVMKVAVDDQRDWR